MSRSRPGPVLVDGWPVVLGQLDHVVVGEPERERLKDEHVHQTGPVAGPLDLTGEPVRRALR